MKCCSLYLGGETEAEMLLKEAKKNSGIYDLFQVPIILLMTSVLYSEGNKKSLPDRKIKLYENTYEFVMDRLTF